MQSFFRKRSHFYEDKLVRKYDREYIVWPELNKKINRYLGRSKFAVVLPHNPDASPLVFQTAELQAKSIMLAFQHVLNALDKNETEDRKALAMKRIKKQPFFKYDPRKRIKKQPFFKYDPRNLGSW